MPAVVSDTSGLHYLAVTRQFDCRPKIFGQVIIPPAVAHITHLKPIFDQLIATHRFRLGKSLYTQALREVGESE